LDDRLKERLTGAIVLVVLVVVLVPAVFRGEGPGVNGTSVASGGSAQQQTYTIDLKGAAPAAAETTAVAPQPAVLPAESTVSAAMEQSSSAISAATVTPGKAVATPPPAAAAPAKPAAQPKPEAKPEPRPAPHAKELPETHAAAAKPAAKADAPAAGGFVVQVGTFSKRENAAVMVKQGAAKGVRLMVAGPDDHGLFRVRSPVVRTRQEAVALRDKMQSQGFKGQVGAVN